MSYMDYDDSLIGEAPCEFCGESYPLCLLIEHQTTHLNEDQYFLEDVNFPEVVNEKPITEVKEDFPVQAPKPLNQITAPKVEEVIPVQAPKPPNQITAPKPDAKISASTAQPLKTSKSITETKKIPQKMNYHSEIEELTTVKGEKLLVYGANIDPVEDLETEKSSYNKPNNPLLSTVTKEDDVIDINSLSDDDSEESLEEFWKRARDLLKKNRGKTYSKKD